MAGAGPQLQIHGERTSGQDVRTQNTTAVLAVANILKTSLGPVGLDKVSPNHRGAGAGRRGAAGRCRRSVSAAGRAASFALLLCRCLWMTLGM